MICLEIKFRLLDVVSFETFGSQFSLLFVFDCAFRFFKFFTFLHFNIVFPVVTIALSLHEHTKFISNSLSGVWFEEHFEENIRILNFSIKVVPLRLLTMDWIACLLACLLHVEFFEMIIIYQRVSSWMFQHEKCSHSDMK